MDRVSPRVELVFFNQATCRRDRTCLLMRGAVTSFGAPEDIMLFQ